MQQGYWYSIDPLLANHAADLCVTHTVVNGCRYDVVSLSECQAER